MVQDECVCPGAMNMESMLLLGAGLMTAAFVAVVVFAPSTLTDEPADWEIVDVCLGSEHSSNPIVAHYHATLRIFLDGSEVSIASDIGINDSECDGMRGIHTHDETGRLHIETPTQMNAPIGAFFEIWGETFNENQILYKVADEDSEVVMYVNDELNDDYQNAIIHDNDIIEIYYREKSD